MAKGKKAFEERKYDVAIVYFKNALQKRPKDAEVYYQLGLTYLAATDVRTGVAYLRKASDLNPKHTGAQLKLAELMAATGNKALVEEAQKRTKDVLSLLPDDADALTLLAQTELSLGSPESAEAHLEQALRKAPQALQPSLVLAQSRLARRDVAGTEHALKQAIEHAPASADPVVYLGQFYLALGRTADAEQQFQGALAIDPKNGPALLAVGGMQIRAGQTEQADATYRRLSAVPDKRYKPVHALFLFQSGKRDQALVEFERLAREDPADRDARTRLVQAYFAMKRTGDAERLLTAALKANPLDVDALLQRSRMYLASGNYAEAQADLDRVLRSRNESPEAHYLVSKLHQARGDTAGQLRELGESLRLNPNSLPVRLELAQVLTASKGAQSALKLLDDAPEEQRNTAAVTVQRNWAMLATGENAEARKGVDRLLAQARLPQAVLQDAVLKFDQKDYPGARASAEECLRLNSEDVAALNLLYRTYSARNQQSAGLERVREYAARRPDSAGIQQFLGVIWLDNGNRPGARKAFEAALATNSSLLAPQLWLAQLDDADGNRENARKRLSTVISSHPAAVQARLLSAQYATADGRSQAAIAEYRKVLDVDPKNLGALNNLAYLLAEASQPDEALKYAQEAKEAAPESPTVDDTMGWVYFRKGMYKAAVSYFENAVAKEATARRKYHLAMAYAKAGESGRAREVLAAGLRMDPKLPEAEAARLIVGDVRP